MVVAGEESRAEQFARQQQDERRAIEAQKTSQRRLQEQGRESALPYGRVLFNELLEALTESVKTCLEAAVTNPTRARIHGAALPYLDSFDSPEQIAAVALVATLDRLTRRQRMPTFCQGIGSALEREARLVRLRQVNGTAQRRLGRMGLNRIQMSSKQTLKALRVPVEEWNDKAKLQVGNLLLDSIIEATGLVRVQKQRIGRITPYIVVPTDRALEVVAAIPPREAMVSYRAMVCPPNPWVGIHGGGRLGSIEPMIRLPVQDQEDRRGPALDPYRQAPGMAKVTAMVNHLQAVPLTCSGDMPGLLRVAWDNGIDGLFPCRRVPPEVPERLGDDYQPEELQRRNRLAAIAHRDRVKNRATRIRVERTIQHAEAMAGRDCWQGWCIDYRGRAYATNAYSTHQGPDYDRALIAFRPEPVGSDGIDWILKAAAGHDGLGRATWADRLAWGQENRQRMVAAAEDPLGRLELWRSTSDPWQFLQLCRGLKEAIETGQTGVPIRLDQTTSGLGILSALLRHRSTARLCNVWGKTPRDLYSVVAERCIAALRLELETSEDPHRRLMAERWLEVGITRSTVKGPVLAQPYGGSYMGAADAMADVMDAALGGDVQIEEFNWKVGIPAKYMAGILWREMKPLVAPCSLIKPWLRTVVTRVFLSGQPLEWTTPSGFPMRVADRMLKVIKVHTMLYGKQTATSFADAPLDAKLDPGLANKAICANFTHSFDAAFMTLVVDALRGRKIAVLPNHDCFATTPAHATELHNLLLHQFRGMWTTDWLEVFVEEVQGRTGVKLPKLPAYGDLAPGEIGENPHVFS